MYYEKYKSYDTNKKVLMDDFIKLFPNLETLNIKIERSNGEIVDGFLSSEQFVFWCDLHQTWLIPVKFINNNGKMQEYIYKFIYIDDLNLSGVSSQDIANIKNNLDSGIYKPLLIKLIHKESPKMTGYVPRMPKNESKMYVDFTRRTPEFAPGTALDVPKPFCL